MSCKWDCHVHTQINQGGWLCFLFCKQDDVFVVSVKIENPVIALRWFINRVCAVSVRLWAEKGQFLMWRIPVPSAGVQPALSSDYLERHLQTVEDH